MPDLIKNLLSDILQRLILRISLVKLKVFKNLLIRLFIKKYKIDLSDYPRKSIQDYKDFNDFFTREIIHKRRPISGYLDDSVIISPVDGKIVEFGKIEEGELIQIKEMGYDLLDLLDGDKKLTETYKNGSFISIYLAPYNYHRVHAPIDGSLEQSKMIPGEMNRVDINALSNIKNLYIKNQRLITEFKGSEFGCIMIMVAARNVASMTTRTHLKRFHKGEDVGTFNLGSTVVVLFPNDVEIKWGQDASIGNNVKMGEKIAQLSKIK